MMKYAASIRNKEATTTAILRRFHRANRLHPTYQAMQEVGRAQRTIFACRYLRDRQLQREIGTGLNVGESWNGGNAVVYFGKGGDIPGSRRDEQELAVLCLRVLQASITYLNTLLIQDVLAGGDLSTHRRGPAGHHAPVLVAYLPVRGGEGRHDPADQPACRHRHHRRRRQRRSGGRTMMTPAKCTSVTRQFLEHATVFTDAPGSRVMPRRPETTGRHWRRPNGSAWRTASSGRHSYVTRFARCRLAGTRRACSGCTRKPPLRHARISPATATRPPGSGPTSRSSSPRAWRPNTTCAASTGSTLRTSVLTTACTPSRASAESATPRSWSAMTCGSTVTMPGDFEGAEGDPPQGSMRSGSGPALCCIPVELTWLREMLALNAADRRS